MRATLVIAAKDLRQRLRDRSAFVVAFIAPVVLASIVTGAFGSGFGPDSFGTKLAVLDTDRSQISRVFVEQVLLSEDITAFAEVTEVCPEDPSGCDARQITDLVEREEVSAGFVIPDGFGDRVQAGAEVSMQVIATDEAPVSAQVATAIAEAFTGQLNATRLAVFTGVRALGGDVSRVAELAAEAAQDRIPVEVVEGDPGSREVSGANYFGPGMAIFFVFFTVSLGATSLLAERSDGTMARLLAAPMSRSAVVGGKALAVFVLGLASMVVMFAFMGLVFSVDWGDPLAIAVITVLIVAAAMGVTAVVQTLARTQEQAANYGSMVGLSFALLGGNFFPLFALPDVIQKISLATPNGWALRGFTDIAYDGARLGDLVPNVVALAAFAAFTSTIAVVRSRRLTVA